MRLIQIKVPWQNHGTVREILEAEDIEYVVIGTRGEEDESVIVQFPIPRPAVEPLLERLRDAGMDEDFRVSLNAETIRSDTPERLADLVIYNRQFKDVIPREELVDKARNMVSNTFTYYIMTALGTVVATSGLLLNSAAVVIGAMVLAPQLGAALMASVGITTNDPEMFVGGLKHQIIGLGFGLLGATAFATVLHSADVLTVSIVDIMTVGQISSRTSPGILSMIIAVTAGAAAAFNLATQDRPTGPLVGAMMSAALIPVVATAGIGIAWDHYRIVIGALVLLAVNVASINLTGPFILWMLGYRPVGWHDSTSRLRKLCSLLPVLLLLFGLFLGASALLGQQVAYTNAVNTVVEQTLDGDEYEGVELRSITAQYNYLGSLSDESEVAVVINRPDDTEYPEIAAALQRNISNVTGFDVIVTVEYVDKRRNVSAERNSSTAKDSAVSPPGQLEPSGQMRVQTVSSSRPEYPRERRGLEGDGRCVDRRIRWSPGSRHK